MPQCEEVKSHERILIKRVQAKTEATEGLGDDRFGFRKALGTRDAVGTLRVLAERCIYRMVRMYYLLCGL